jgi:hypothetical protein
VIWRQQLERVELSDDEYVQKIETRISDKLKQTKRQSDNPGRIVVARLGMFKNDEDRALRIADKLQQILMPRYENVSAIMLVHRNWVRGIPTTGGPAQLWLHRSYLTHHPWRCATI